MSSEYLNNKKFEKIIQSFNSSQKGIVKYDLIIEDLEASSERLKKRNIVSKTNKDKIIFYKKEKDEQSIILEDSKEKLALAFMVLSENIAKFSKFSNIDLDDAVQEGVCVCFDKVDRFDKRKGKAFNYMTTCIFNHFRHLYRVSKSYQEFKVKYIEHIILDKNITVSRNGKDYINPLEAGNSYL